MLIPIGKLQAAFNLTTREVNSMLHYSGCRFKLKDLVIDPIYRNCLSVHFPGSRHSSGYSAIRWLLLPKDGREDPFFYSCPRTDSSLIPFHEISVNAKKLETYIGSTMSRVFGFRPRINRGMVYLIEFGGCLQEKRCADNSDANTVLDLYIQENSYKHNLTSSVEECYKRILCSYLPYENNSKRNREVFALACSLFRSHISDHKGIASSHFRAPQYPNDFFTMLAKVLEKSLIALSQTFLIRAVPFLIKNGFPFVREVKGLNKYILDKTMEDYSRAQLSMNETKKEWVDWQGYPWITRKILDGHRAGQIIFELNTSNPSGCSIEESKGLEKSEFDFITYYATCRDKIRQAITGIRELNGAKSKSIQVLLNWLQSGNFSQSYNAVYPPKNGTKLNNTSNGKKACQRAYTLLLEHEIEPGFEYTDIRGS